MSLRLPRFVPANQAALPDARCCAHLERHLRRF
jgi:hypothetical protein